MWTQAMRVKSPCPETLQKMVTACWGLTWGRCYSKGLHFNPFHIHNHLFKFSDCLFFHIHTSRKAILLWMKKGLPIPIHIHTIWFLQQKRSRASDPTVTPSGYLPGSSCLPLPLSAQLCPPQLPVPVIIMKLMLLWGKPDLLRPNSLLFKLGFDGSFYFPCLTLVGLDFPTSVCDLIFWYKIITCFYWGSHRGKRRRRRVMWRRWTANRGERRGKPKDDCISVPGTLISLLETGRLGSLLHRAGLEPSTLMAAPESRGGNGPTSSSDKKGVFSRTSLGWVRRWWSLSHL